MYTRISTALDYRYRTMMSYDILHTVYCIHVYYVCASCITTCKLAEVRVYEILVSEIQ